MGTTSNGLYCLSGDKKISQPVTRGNIASIYEDSSKELWICTWEEGLYRIKQIVPLRTSVMILKSKQYLHRFRKELL